MPSRMPAFFVLALFLIAVLGGFAVVAIGGCTAQQQQQTGQVLDRAASVIDAATRTVDAAQAVVDAYRDELAALPEGEEYDAQRHSIESKLSDAEIVLNRARFDLKLAQIALGAVKPAAPTSQPAQ